MTTETKESNFERLAAINVNEQVEKKGGLSYLSWAWAVDRLLRADPDAEWHYADTLYLQDATALVFCTVKAFGKSRTMQLPVMDHRNRAIANPDAFAINTAMQRCLVKCIALHGLGLYIYAGEDLPPGEAKDDDASEPEHRVPDPKRPNTATQVAVDAWDLLSAADQKYLGDLAAMVMDMVDNSEPNKAHQYIEAQMLSIEHKLALWKLFPSKIRTALQKAARPAPIPKAPLLQPPPLASQP